MYSERGNLVNERSYREGKLIEEGIQMKVEIIDLITYYDDNVTIKRRGPYLDSIPIGMHHFYRPNGKPERAVRYNNQGIRTAEGSLNENDKREGEWKTYFETGELRSTGQYLNDYQHGQWLYYFQDGKREQTGNFRNGIMDGEWKWYYPNGQLWREEIYTRNRQNGLSIEYSDSATVVARGEYADGEREGFWIENVGEVHEEGDYVMGLKNGIWKTFFKDGTLYHRGNFVQGNPDGKHEFYYPDGTLREEQYYVMGRRDKNWKKYYENGTLFLTITYKNDVETRINGVRVEDIRP
jgi:antitoxin component YwqK of YwqJK toxin-antitoxin module